MRMIVVLAILVVVTGCPKPPAEEAPPTKTSASAPASKPADPYQAFVSLDGRIGVPMPPPMAHHHRQQMRSHLEVVQRIVTSLAAKDYDGAKVAALEIAASGETSQQCEKMGKGASGFTEQAMRFHESANAIVSATERDDAQAALTALGATLSTCTACHATFRQDVVSWDAYQVASARR